jgi:CRP-like cAMP-binding protein
MSKHMLMKNHYLWKEQVLYKGHVVYRQGQKCNKIYLIFEGEFEQFVEFESTKENEVNFN